MLQYAVLAVLHRAVVCYAVLCCTAPCSPALCYGKHCIVECAVLFSLLLIFGPYGEDSSGSGSLAHLTPESRSLRFPRRAADGLDVLIVSATSICCALLGAGEERSEGAKHTVSDGSV